MNQDPTPSAAGQDRRAAVPVRWRVLVADDHPFSRAVIALQLRHLGCGATLVEDGLHALAALERDRYDLLISDCHMPRLDGPALARRIRAGESPGTARLPILAWSGSSSERALVHWREAGMDETLRRLAPFYAEAKATLASYGLSPDESIAGLRTELVEQKGDQARVRVHYPLGKREVDTVVSLQRREGRWYLADYLRHVEQALAVPAAEAAPSFPGKEQTSD